MVETSVCGTKPGALLLVSPSSERQGKICFPHEPDVGSAREPGLGRLEVDPTQSLGVRYTEKVTWDKYCKMGRKAQKHSQRRQLMSENSNWKNPTISNLNHSILEEEKRVQTSNLILRLFIYQSSDIY